MQRLSGIATLTARFVNAIIGTRARILDTRKTTPGWRRLEKYAVRAGGGVNHRMDLADQILIKDNHLAACDGDITLAVRRVREMIPRKLQIEVECESPAQVQVAVDAGVDIVLLDNMPVELLRQAVLRRNELNSSIELEASGGVNLQSLRAIAETGVERISAGALTHSARVLDIALDWRLPAGGR